MESHNDQGYSHVIKETRIVVKLVLVIMVDKRSTLQFYKNTEKMRKVGKNESARK